MQCTIEIFEEGQWQDCCTIQIENPALGSEGASLLQYDEHYVHKARQIRKAPFVQSPVSLRYPLSLEPQKLPHWPAFLMDLIPCGAGREYLLEQLQVPDESASNWALLNAGAFNPIGKLRVKEAAVFYDRHMLDSSPGLLQGFALDDVLQRSEPFLEYIQTYSILAAGATSVQGTTPKFFLTRGKDGLWYADGFLPDEQAARHYLIKLSRARTLADWKILENEPAYMQVARDMGLFVFDEMPNWQEDMLFVPRFDRKVTDAGVIRYHQESLTSLGNLIGSHESLTQNKALALLRAYATHPTQTTIEFLKRDVLNIALGNTDNHPNNISLQIVDGEVRLAPLYDFAPMNLDSDEMERPLNWWGSNGKEQTNWVDIVDSFAFSPAEMAEIRKEMHAFSHKLETLEDRMNHHGVNLDIREGRYYVIQSLIMQLRALK